MNSNAAIVPRHKTTRALRHSFSRKRHLSFHGHHLTRRRRTVLPRFYLVYDRTRVFAVQYGIFSGCTHTRTAVRRTFSISNPFSQNRSGMKL